VFWKAPQSLGKPVITQEPPKMLAHAKRYPPQPDIPRAFCFPMIATAWPDRHRSPGNVAVVLRLTKN
jgi:hypothetical protein